MLDPSTEERLLAQRRIEPNGCWVFTGGRFKYSHGPRRGEPSYGAMVVEGKTRSTHRLAAALWLDFDLDSKLCVLHKCDNPPCFNPGHLYAGTLLENNRDRLMRTGYDRGQDNGNSKLTEPDVVQIKALLRWGRMSKAEIARRFGVDRTNISCIARGLTWAHVE